MLGAGGGLALQAFAEAQPKWIFDGVDPSAEMLALALDTPEQEEALLREEGCKDVSLFHAAGVFRGWIGYA